MRALLLVLSLALVLGGACSKPASRVDRYTANGKIVALPAGESKLVDIHHERIPDYKLQNGTVKGMASMVMSFAPGPGVSLSGFAVGEPIRFSFEVHWGETPALRLTRLEKLPAGTPLTLE